MSNPDVITNEAKNVSQWFEVDLTIKVFGHVIFSLHFPPKNQ